MTWKPEVDEIKKRRELALAQGGPEAVAKQPKMSANEEVPPEQPTPKTPTILPHKRQE